MKGKLSLIAFSLMLAAPSHAQLFKIKVVDYGGLSGAPQALIDAFEAELAKAQADINKDLPSAAPNRLMEGMANSSVIAGKGIGSDYASGMQVAIIGAGVGVGADLEKDKESKSDLSGAGIQGGLMIGFNLGFLDAEKILGLDTNRLNVYFNGIAYNHEQKLGKNDKDTVEADLKSFGVHFSYDWVKGNGSKLFGWGGIKLHTGYEYNKSSYTFTSSINETVNVSNSGQTISGTITGRPRAQIDVTTHSIPVEISSSVQFLYLLSLYGGLGADFNFGEAKGSGALNADPTTLNYSGGGGDPVVQADANIDGTGKVTGVWARAFAGVQVNLPFTRIFVQADKPFGNDIVGATAGVRFVY